MYLYLKKGRASLNRLLQGEPPPPPLKASDFLHSSIPSFLLTFLPYWSLRLNFFLTAPFLQMPGHLEASELVLFYPKVRGLPRTFAWLTGQSCVSTLAVISSPLISLTFQANIMVFVP